VIPPLYWDASAVLSALSQDLHTGTARRHLRAKSVHLLSSLAFTETAAVLARLAARRELSATSVHRATRSLFAAPWVSLELQPDRRLVSDLAARCALRGADLWHLGLALTLRAELPELRIVTFDERLAAAAEAEGVGLA
jgi:predicted nucleic acid-binding protein